MKKPWDLSEAHEARRDFFNLVNKTAASTRIPPDPRRKRLTRKEKRTRIASTARSHVGALLRHADMTDREILKATLRKMTNKQDLLRS